MWDATVASIAYLFLIPLLAYFVSPWFCLIYIIDLPAALVPILVQAIKRKEVRQALSSFPSFVVLRNLNSLLFLEAIWSELVMKKPLLTYEKGH